jgi:hypothetical protein
MPTPDRCPARYEREGGRDPGDRIVKCHLEAGHPGEHEEEGTEVTWPQDDLDRFLAEQLKDPEFARVWQRQELRDWRAAYERGFQRGRTQGAEDTGRAGYDQAVATLHDVAQRTGSPAARWAADYLAADPDRLAPGASRRIGPQRPAGQPESARSCYVETFESRSAGWVFRCHACDITRSSLTEGQAAELLRVHVGGPAAPEGSALDVTDKQRGRTQATEGLPDEDMLAAIACATRDDALHQILAEDYICDDCREIAKEIRQHLVSRLVGPWETAERSEPAYHPLVEDPEVNGLATHLCSFDGCYPAPCADHLSTAGAALKWVANRRALTAEQPEPAGKPEDGGR